MLDNPWSNVAESIELLYHNSVKTDKGIEEVIKTLDVKLSEAIMHAMENGPELEKKVSGTFFHVLNLKSCLCSLFSQF